MDPRQPTPGAGTARLGVFARWPEVGRVKTRLSPALSPEQACELHRAMVADTLAVAAASGADEAFLLWADAPAGAVDSGVEVPAGLRVGSQSGGTLGERLVTAFDALLADGARAVVVGTDCPGLRAEHVGAAFEALREHDVVLGPASDGGYWLVGLRQPAPALFTGIAWGSEAVLAETLERASRAGFSVRLLEALDDLDTAEDLARVVARDLADPEAVPKHLCAALAGMGMADSAASETP